MNFVRAARCPVVLIALCCSGCAVQDGVGYPGMGTRVYSETADGGVIWAHFTTNNASSVNTAAANYCARKSVPVGQIIARGAEGEFSTYQFTCGRPQNLPNYNAGTVSSGAGQPLASYSQPSTTPAAAKPSLEDAKVKCKDLGFKAGTERFGDCVLKLSN